MDFLGALAESIDRFYSYYLVVLRSEPRSVPSGTCPDVKNQELGAWKQREPVVVDLRRLDAFVSSQKVICALIVDGHVKTRLDSWTLYRQ